MALFKNLSNSRLEENSDSNQTGFVSDLPFRQSQSSASVPMPSKKKTPTILIVAAAIFFLILAVLFLAMSRRQMLGTEELSPTPTPLKMESDPLQLRIETLRSDLKDADPTRQTLPFPQIDLEFSMEE